MKACILSYKSIRQSKDLYTKLLEEMKKRFDSVLMIPIEKVSMVVDEKGVSARYRGEEMDKFDVILPRIGPTYVPYGYLILKTLEGNTYFPNKPESYLIANDKFQTLMKLSEKKIPVPKTISVVSKELAKTSSKSMGEPVIIKSEGGSGGKGVVYSKDLKSTKTMIDAISIRKGEKMLIEEFLPNPGEDIRLFVIGDEVHAAAKRVADKEDIRSNIHAGGKYKAFEPDPEMKSIAVRAAKTIGADICGVDIIVSNGKPYVVECNMNPGFFISQVTGINLFKRISDYVYFKAKEFYSEENTLSDFIAKTISFIKRYQ
jgi:ribosomal protein S6--L-glutamate ligase